nr:protein FAR1-related sequence 5-like [Tanacetum cinerariifolium]
MLYYRFLLSPIIDCVCGTLRRNFPPRCWVMLMSTRISGKTSIKLVWNVYITPSVFQERWHALIQKYNLSENKWLSDMYEIRDSWVPGYFSEVPMCGVMKTTSQSKSLNAFFQRYTQRVLENENAKNTLVMLTKLPIERHACAVYTHSIFRDVQSEICKGLYACSLSGSRFIGGIEKCIIHQRDKRKNTVVEAKEDGSFECSCGYYNNHRFLCRHVLCVFGTLGMDNILENYISRRWRENPLPDHLRDKRHRYGPCIEESKILASDIYSRVEDCINLIRNDPDKLRVSLTKVTDMKKELENDMSSQNEPQNKDAMYEDLLGIKARDTVVIMNPNKCTNKGHRRFKSAAEKDVGEVDVNESEEDEEDVEVEDVDEDDGTDEHDEDKDED